MNVIFVNPFLDAAPLQFTYIGSETSNTVIAASGQTGDLVIAFSKAYSAADNSASGLFTPTGWTQIEKESISPGSAGLTNLICRRVLAPGDAGAATSFVVSGAGVTTHQLIFRPSKAIASITVGFNNSAESAATPGSLVITSGSATAAAIVVAGYGSSGSISPRNFSPAADGSVGSGATYALFKIYNSSPADVTVSMEDEGIANIVSGCYLTAI